ncbi:ATP-binding cassette domain-containing protein [Methanoculleus sp. 10]|uniref:ATP-binding cassette domain-containing protein n=1 Tax=Methanoculleus sp. 10 TaxID=430615 RepID=UPI0025E857E0|nr:ATP-binding cassette domain-containing protein [Methanoculleus sp. 10]
MIGATSQRLTPGGCGGRYRSSQDLFLFHTTIEENIRYSRPDATIEEVVKAAQKAQIHDDILRLPDGYRTVVGERGTRLSVGQRQRIAIARAFLKDAPILILDEPTSALDLQTEDLIGQTLRVLVRDRTTILISHRPSLLELADRVLAIEDGQVRECRGSGAASCLPPGCPPSPDLFMGCGDAPLRHGA